MYIYIYVYYTWCLIYRVVAARDSSSPKGTDVLEFATYFVKQEGKPGDLARVDRYRAVCAT